MGVYQKVRTCDVIESDVKVLEYTLKFNSLTEMITFHHNLIPVIERDRKCISLLLYGFGHFEVAHQIQH